MNTPPATPPSLGTTNTGLDPRIAAALAYLVGWLTGILFYLIEPENRYVRFHAAQSIVGLGGLWLIGVVLFSMSFMSMFVSAGGFHMMMWLAQLTWLAGLIVWLICLFKAYSGEMWKLPIAGDIAERMVDGRPGV